MTVQIVTGDCRLKLAKLPSESVHCVVTSPPYFSLRDYGVDGQIGLEATPDAFVSELVAVFREARRVLRGDGTLWLNLGDSYASAWACKRRSIIGNGSPDETVDRGRTGPGLKEKDLIGIPWRVAFALQADGWYLRQDIIWSKPNPMPESVRDRCTKAHEYLFMLSKSERYYFDADAIAEPAATNDMRRPYGSEGAWQLDGRSPEQRHGGELRDSWKGSRFHTGKTAEHQLGRASKNRMHKAVTEYEASDSEEHRTKAGLLKISEVAYPTRNKRSVWTVATQSFKEAHFATFPPALIEPCIKAGCVAGGTVLDPFGGAGTTGLVADRLQRNAILIELNPEYAAMARKRIDTKAPLFVEAAE